MKKPEAILFQSGVKGDVIAEVMQRAVTDENVIKYIVNHPKINLFC